MEDEYKAQFANNDLVYTWARYWQLADQLDILRQFEEDDDNQ